MRERLLLKGSLLCLCLTSVLPAAWGANQSMAGYLYVAHRGHEPVPGQLSSYRISATGGLSLVGSPQDLGKGLTALAVDPSGRFVYVCSMAGKLWGFRSDAGVLTPLPGSPYSIDGDQESLAIAPSGRFLYMADSAIEIIRGFTLDPASGVPTQFEGKSARAANNVAHLVIDRSGRYLYATATDTSSAVLSYTIDPVSGSLTAFAEPAIPGGWFPTLSLSPDGRFLYAWSDLPDITGYAIDAGSGRLTEVAGSPFAASPLSRLAWSSAASEAVALHDDSLSTLAADTTTGALQWLGSSVSTPGSASEDVVLGPDSRFVYVADSAASTIAMFSLDAASGRLAFVRSFPTAPRPFLLSASAPAAR